MIVKVEKVDYLLWLGRYMERTYTTINLFKKDYDEMIDHLDDSYKDFCIRLQIPNIYTSKEDFIERYAFSVYTDSTDRPDMEGLKYGVDAVITFLKASGIISGKAKIKENAKVINERDLVNVKSKEAGVLRRRVNVNDTVAKGSVLAEIIDPYDFSVKKKIKSGVDGTVFFTQDNPLAFANAVLFKIIEKK